jgi:hypothetical protein
VNEYIRGVVWPVDTPYNFDSYPVYELQIQGNTTAMPIAPIRIRSNHSAGSTFDARYTGQIVSPCDSLLPGRYLENLQNEYKHRCEQERLAAERLAIVKAAQQAALEQGREQEPESEEPAWDDLGGISDVQASLVRLDIGRPHHK